MCNRNKTTVRNDKQRWKRSTQTTEAIKSESRPDKYDLQSTFSVSLLYSHPLQLAQQAADDEIKERQTLPIASPNRAKAGKIE